jgi:uncharacterized protein YggT (Ycf19 family)
MLHHRRRAHGLVFTGGELRGRAVHAVARVFDVVFTFIHAVLGIRFLLELIEARRGSGFYQLVASASGPFYAPFKDIIATGTVGGSHPVVWSLVVAMVAYALLHGMIRALLRVVAGSA